LNYNFCWLFLPLLSSFTPPPIPTSTGCHAAYPTLISPTNPSRLVEAAQRSERTRGGNDDVKGLDKIYRAFRHMRGYLSGTAGKSSILRSFKLSSSYNITSSYRRYMLIRTVSTALLTSTVCARLTEAWHSHQVQRRAYQNYGFDKSSRG
jgi:hypothetical protein